MVTGAETRTLPAPAFDPGPRIAIVAAPFYAGIADALIAGARAALSAADAKVEVIEVPGALEIAPAIRTLAATRGFEGFVALGCVIRGETTHYETVCEESARGLTLLGALGGLAIGNGILTCETMAQAEVRADPGAMDKGGGAALACLHLVALARRFRPLPPGLGRAADEAEVLLAAQAALTRTA